MKPRGAKRKSQFIFFRFSSLKRKDLGVTVTSTFKTSLHCQQAVTRARRILFQLRHGFAVLTPDICQPLYLGLVSPIPEYGQQSSSKYLQQNIASTERIQRLTTHMVKGKRELSYEERLRRLNLFISRAAPSSWIPHPRLQHFPRTPWFPTSGDFEAQRDGTYEDITSKYVVVVSI